MHYYRKDDPTHKAVTIAKDNIEEAFYQLSDGQMIKKNIFSKYYGILDNVVSESTNVQSNVQSNEIDPEAFLRTSAVNTDILNKIKSVDISKVKNENIGSEILKNTTNKTKVAQSNIVQNQPIQNQFIPNMNESAIIRQDNSPQQIPNNTNTNVSQYKVYDNDDDAYQDFLNQQNKTQPKPQPIIKPIVNIDELYENEKLAYGEEEANKRRLKRLQRQPTSVSQSQQTNNLNQPQVQQSQLDPNEMVFSTFKRKHDISVNIEFKDKIGKPEFVKMMVENMEGDIVQYYKKIIINNIYTNIKIIEEQVEKQIIKEIFGDDIPDEYLKEETDDDMKNEQEKKSKRKYTKKASVDKNEDKNEDK